MLDISDPSHVKAILGMAGPPNVKDISFFTFKGYHPFKFSGLNQETNFSSRKVSDNLIVSNTICLLVF